MASSEDHTKASPLPKACENCRIRKIRCNRTSPCSNCSSSGIECRPSSKLPEHRPRMIVSNHYEKQIERIHERLSGIESALRSFSLSQNNSPQSHTSQPTSQPSSLPASESTPSQYEGDSSFQHQSVRASEVARSLNFKNDGDLSNAIDTLKNILNTKDVSLNSANDLHFTSVEDRRGVPSMEVLPVDFVIKLLAKVKERVPMCFFLYTHPDEVQLERLCQKAYFPTESMSLGEMTTMYGMLWYIISEYITFGDRITKEFDCEKYMNACERNFHAGIETYTLIAEPTYHHAFALMLAANKAQDEGKVILCWSLSSAAARHLQALGYHREAALQHDTPLMAERKRHLFWTVYGIEKNMALNLGRASSFQDWDIDVKMFKLSTDPAILPWNIGTVNFIELSRVQGQIYEQLYSASASRKSQAQRAKSIDELSKSLEKLHDNLRKVDHSQAMYSEFIQMFYESCDVIYFSLLTLLHRAASNPDDGTEISSKCFEAAKMCLRSHLHYFPMFARQGEAVITGYVNWVLLYCSFTPFIVVFLHALASTSLEDVKLLQAMTSSLEPVNTVSPVLHRLHEVCRVFSRVAEVMVRNNQSASDTQPPGTISTAGGFGSYDQTTDSLFFPGFTGHHGFDPAQSQLPDIFMQGGNEIGVGGNVNLNMDDMSAYFGNWVSSNQPAMDLFSIDLGTGCEF